MITSKDVKIEWTPEIVKEITKRDRCDLLRLVKAIKSGKYIQKFRSFGWEGSNRHCIVGLFRIANHVHLYDTIFPKQPLLIVQSTTSDNTYIGFMGLNDKYQMPFSEFAKLIDRIVRQHRKLEKVYDATNPSD